ncbi:MAG: larC [Friedmanniella sp.]|nr:larC [Friedmanniella sp.]
MTADRHVWVDASAGVAGDMLLGALVDAGAPVAAVQAHVDAVIPGSVRLRLSEVLRAGQRAAHVDVDVLTDDLPHRTWATIRERLTDADLPEPVRRRALAAFGRLATAEARVHGVDEETVHFHEVGALDSIADVVGVCSALHLLDVATLSAGPVALGSGRIRAAHGDIGVPVPAVVELSTGWAVVAGGAGELTTPTGMALLAALAERGEDLPAMTLLASGSGAGTKDTPGRPNVTRVLLGRPAGAAGGGPGEAAVVLEANVDDFDPRLWPGVLTALVAAGAADAWLTPIVMKKGRPAHTLSVLARPESAGSLRALVLRLTSTIGVRETTVAKSSLPRGWVDVELPEGPVPVKIAHAEGVVWQATPEFDAVEALAASSGRPVRDLLEAAARAAGSAGWVTGAPVPPHLRGHA